MMDEPTNETKSSPEDRRNRRPKDRLHGVTLQVMVTSLVDQLGWDEMGRRIRIRCFTDDPSIPSSLKFLRKTPWARAKVEQLYLERCRD